MTTQLTKIEISDFSAFKVLKNLFFAVALLAISGASQAASFSTLWVPQSGDNLTTVGTFNILEYKNAGTGGIDWRVSGTGTWDGNGTSQLWLINPQNLASVTFSSPSTAVAFMMDGDYNDGFAEFLVDGTSVGKYDLYNLGDKSLIVYQLGLSAHTISVRQVGQQSSQSTSNHVEIYGGAALVPTPLPAALWLVLSSIASLGIFSVRRNKH